MIHHDLGHWPLVLTVAHGPVTRTDYIRLLDDWNRWLDRGERFATLRVFADGDALVHPEGAAQDAKAWLQANAGRLRAQVVGMATSVPAEHLERMRRMNAEKLFGVPAQVFGDVDAALGFLDWLIAPPNDACWDRAAIRASAGALVREPSSRENVMVEIDPPARERRPT